ncbi:MAG TPA: leucyl/phenylalanyl-tRNA--protein transferase [Niabella sp.]|nr:leucyl/phenylalanyl-tRNA--protein transferase [Niabella sp.]HOZ96218.1 leucyl/phenylalanyl-tRNA--protein transferase [Niabella sp.]HQW13583.1 leucyl/phenylalanyl-tRNA--protein transferase [Niabella sp.]HQX18977.1 leucyl/phenylalanyl-tRNA--protein transferase [Niabella sp.]HQX40482.1 leucyl/phenylalanyl-tRNA--protein transferase [Niabella sp.]
MAIFALDESIYFPPSHLAEPDGLLAIGGDLSIERLLLAYRSGIFPWYSEPPILWWCPNPRFILIPQELKISKSLKPLLNRNAFEFTINKCFKEVISQCKNVYRPHESGTWINEEIVSAYCKLHEIGFAHSAEVWQDGQLVGGLYGIKLGKVFFGESMFSLVSNASKFAFTKYVQALILEDVQLIDCQVYTPYLESLGAKMIDGTRFQNMIKHLA